MQKYIEIEVIEIKVIEIKVIEIKVIEYGSNSETIMEMMRDKRDGNL